MIYLASARHLPWGDSVWQIDIKCTIERGESDKPKKRCKARGREGRRKRREEKRREREMERKPSTNLPTIRRGQHAKKKKTRGIVGVARQDTDSMRKCQND